MISRVNGHLIAKSTVASYRLVGLGSKEAGIIFVEKDSHASLTATKEVIYDALEDGKSVLIFSERKTHEKETTITFQKGSFDIAAELGIPVLPLALDYDSKAVYWDHSECVKRQDQIFQYLNIR